MGIDGEGIERKKIVISLIFLKVALRSIWKRITQKKRLDPYITSMQERMKEVLANKGYKTNIDTCTVLYFILFM